LRLKANASAEAASQREPTLTFLFPPTHPPGEMKPTLDNPGTGQWFVYNADQSVWIISSRAIGITVYPAVFIHRSAIPKRVFLGNYGRHTFLGNMKSWRLDKYLL
jgi:hypothetical protein